MADFIDFIYGSRDFGNIVFIILFNVYCSHTITIICLLVFSFVVLPVLNFDKETYAAAKWNKGS